MTKLKSREHTQKIALILGALRAHELCPSAAPVERGIVTRSNIIAAVCKSVVEHRAELYLPVADYARIRSRAAQIFGGKIVHDLILEFGSEVEHPMLYPDSPRHSLRVLYVAVRAVAGLQAQSNAHGVVSALLEQSRRNGAVNSAAHSYKHALHLCAPLRHFKRLYHIPPNYAKRQKPCLPK